MKDGRMPAGEYHKKLTIKVEADAEKKNIKVYVTDNGIGMTEEIRRRCTETHFSTKRDNAIYEGNSTGMGLGLSFVVVILEHHQATFEISSEPLGGALFRVGFPLAKAIAPEKAT